MCLTFQVFFSIYFELRYTLFLELVSNIPRLTTMLKCRQSIVDTTNNKPEQSLITEHIG